MSEDYSCCEVTASLHQLVSGTIKSKGLLYLTEEYIELSKLPQIIPSKIALFNLKNGLKDYILTPVTRFCVESKSMRKLIKLIKTYGNEQHVISLEIIWREVITEWVINELKSFFHKISKSTTIDTSILIVDNLIKMLRNARETSKLDMSLFNSSIMNTDLGFMVAIRRLPSQLSFEIYKSLAVRISYLLDSQKQQNNLHNNLNGITNLTSVIDLIQVSSSCVK